jgi:hypothetical protein
MPRQTEPRLSREAAKSVICDLLAANGGTMRGKVRLNKAFYFAHLYYWREADGVLTDYPIVRLPHGPCINDASELLAELSEEGRISVQVGRAGPYQEYVYRLQCDWQVDRNSPTGKAIYDAIELVEGRTGADLSELTHEHSRSWQTTPNGQEMDIYVDLIEDDELERMRKAVAAVKERESSVWPKPPF